MRTSRKYTYRRGEILFNSFNRIIVMIVSSESKCDFSKQKGVYTKILFVLKDTHKDLCIENLNQYIGKDYHDWNYVRALTRIEPNLLNDILKLMVFSS